MTAAKLMLPALCMPLLHDPTEDWAPIELDEEERIAAELLSSPGDMTEGSVATFIRLGYIRFNPRTGNYMATTPDGGWHLPSEGLRCSLCQDWRTTAQEGEIRDLTKQVKMLKADLAIQTAAFVHAKEENGALKRQLVAFEEAFTQVHAANEAERGRAVKALCLAKRYKTTLEELAERLRATRGAQPMVAPGSASQQSIEPELVCKSQVGGLVQVGSVCRHTPEDAAGSRPHNVPTDKQSTAVCLAGPGSERDAGSRSITVPGQSLASEGLSQGAGANFRLKIYSFKKPVVPANARVQGPAPEGARPSTSLAAAHMLRPVCPVITNQLSSGLAGAPPHVALPAARQSDPPVQQSGAPVCLEAKPS